MKNGLLFILPNNGKMKRFVTIQYIRGRKTLLQYIHVNLMKGSCYEATL